MEPFADPQPATRDEPVDGLLAAESFWAWEQDRQLRYTHVVPVATAPSLDPRCTIGFKRWELPDARPLRGGWSEHRNALADRLPFQNFRYLVFAGSGRERCLAESGEPQFDAAGDFTGWRGTTRDITQQWRQQRRLQEAERLLQVAAKVARFGAWSFEVATRRLTWTQEPGLSQAGPGAQCTDAPEHVLDTYAPADRQLLLAAYQACVREGTPFDLELQALTAHGRPKWVRVVGEAVRGAGGEVVRLEGAYQDIHKARLAAEELRAGEQRLRMTLDSLADGFLTLDRQWRITYMNPAAEAILALEAGALLGARLWEAFPETRDSVFGVHYRQAMDEGRVSRFEAFYPPLSMWFRVSAFPSRQGIAVSFTDITAAQLAREQLLQANAELEDRVRERTAELRQAHDELASFTEAVAHDLRAPLEGIDGFSRALADRLPAGDEKLGHYAARIRAGVSRMESLLDALLELSRVGRSEFQPRRVNLSALAACTVQVLRATEPGRDAEVEVQDGLEAWGDARLLRTLLENLIGNVRKSGGGQRLARIAVGQREDGAFFVRDDGAGIGAAQAQELFAPLRRLHPDEDLAGMGMGLASARRAVQRHGGRIWAETGDGGGVAFCFTLAPAPAGTP